MNHVPLARSSTVIPLEQFWRSVLLYHNRPNLINSKLVAVSPVLFCEVSLCSTNIGRIHQIFTREALLYEIRKLKDLSLVTPEFIEAIIKSHAPDVVVTPSTWDAFNGVHQGVFVSVRILLAKIKKGKCLEFVIFDKKNKLATFFAVQEQDEPIVAPYFPYHLELTLEGNLQLVINSFEDADTGNAEWLAAKLFPKLLDWAENLDDDDNAIKSLTLVPPDAYCSRYANLKAKYAEDLVKAWPDNAKTDPKKFVYEDLAIAAYLICLWRQIGSTNINFVDCGCGNGLLVYILNQEGYTGRGFDVRSRKIWKMFEGKAQLKVETASPISAFPDANWILGNHSDELTPWIPVMALRSSPKTNFFVLPCCSYDFNGRKYVRVNTQVSRYQDFLSYVQSISVKCGFKTSIDKLRIPSTKRTCLVGVRENFDETKWAGINVEVGNFVDSKLESQFVPRSDVEEVRNCTKLNRDLIERIVRTVCDRLLCTQHLVERASDKPWNKGGTVSLSDLSRMVSSDDLKSLKSEFGGLQTLLKNHGYIFKVRAGCVSLQEPLILNDGSAKYRDKPCWCYRNHPDGCLHTNETCAYKH